VTAHLLAAGPGDPGLWTVRAEQLLAAAPAVVCDTELAGAVRALAPGATIDAVAGAAGACGPLVRRARAQEGVVRLARGDRLVWEAGGIEAAALAAAGLPFAVVPAVVAAFAHPAARGVPVMTRALAATLTVAVGVLPPAVAGGTVVFQEGPEDLAPVVTGAVADLDLTAGVPR
jgi:siroheme synthase